MENKEKPTWLQILEAESWQAEMLVSGVAIYGALLLPDLIRQLIDMALLWLPEGALNICYFIFWYLTICASILIVSFILHFVLRALWIGMIGLVSVFPNGINRNTDYHSEHFLQQLFEEFPDVNHFNRRLDDFCSLMFGITFGVVIMIIAVCILISVCLIVSVILAIFLPVSVSTSFLTLILLFLIPAILSGILNGKALREKKWVQRIHFTLSIKIFGRIMYNVFYEPGYYILYILLTNFKRERMGIWVVLGIFLIMLISFPVFMNSNVGLLRQKAFFEMAETDHRIFVDNYEDQMVPGRAVFAPLLPSDVITGNVLRVFIPMSRREKVLVDQYCAAYEEDKTLSRRENNRRRRNLFKDCRVNYYEFYVNDNKMDSLEFFRHTHPNAGEEGLLTYISAKHFTAGINRLRIVHLYQNESGEKKESVIPFWYGGSGY